MSLARAHSNIALIKYWGKRNTPLKLPHNSSLSMTLDKLYTETLITSHSGHSHSLFLNQKKASAKETNRVASFLETLRQHHPYTGYYEIHSNNNFPTAAGLASSASAFAALVTAWNHHEKKDLSLKEQSILARIGSGSASRSLHGGFVKWEKGHQEDGSDSFAEPITVPNWNLKLLVLVLEQGQKKVSSGIGMQRTVESSPYYPTWVKDIDKDIQTTIQALHNQDFHLLGQTIEHNAMRMHASALAAWPPVLYWQASTLSTLQALWQLREAGFPLYITMDAGPNIKVLIEEQSEAELLKLLSNTPEIKKIISCALGPKACILDA